MPNKSTIIIAIDGPAGSGKGTLGHRLGAALDFPVLDTGLLYRAVGLIVRQNGQSLEDQTSALQAADRLHDELATSTEFLKNPELRSAESGQAASMVSSYPSVRQALFDLQRRFALKPPNDKKGAILDGRDIGTVICPDADVKLYLIADTEVRAIRRAKELYADRWEEHVPALIEQTRQRDSRDSDRAVAPLKPAMDAMIIDTSKLNTDDVFQQAYDHIRAKLADRL